MELRTTRRQSAQGFTIVELLISIVVIGILAAITIVAFSGMRARALESEKTSKFSQVHKAILNYYAVNGNYPGNSEITGSAGAALIGMTLKGVEPSDAGYPGNGIEGGGDADSGTRHIRYIAHPNPDGSGFSCNVAPCQHFSLSYYDRIKNQTIYLRSR